MTQQPLTWLITAPEGESFTKLLTVACRGNDKIAGLLNTLLYEGALVANRMNLKLKEIEFVHMHLNLDKLMEGLRRLQRSASKQTIIKWREKLEEWGFLKFDGHRQEYDLYFHKIEEAIKQRPPKETTPRGRHASKMKDSSVETGDSTLDNGEIQPSTIGDSSVERRYSSFDYETEIQAWRGEKSKLESHISKLESEMLKLESLISHERACRADLEAKVDALYNLVNNLTDINLNERKEEEPPEPPPSSRPDDSFIHSSDMNFQGGVTDPPASAKGVSSATRLHVYTSTDDTLNLDTQHTLMQQSSEGVASSPDAHSAATVNEQLHNPIAMQTDKTQNGYNSTSPGAQGYKTNDSETPDHDAVMGNSTAEVKPSGKTVREESPKKRDLLAEATPEAQAVVHEWLNIFNRPIAITATLIEHAETLAKYKPEPGRIAACRLWMYATDRKKWYSTHGMHLGDVAREFERFLSLGDVPVPTDRTKKRSIDRSDFSQQSLDKEFYPNKQEPTNQEKAYAF